MNVNERERFEQWVVSGLSDIVEGIRDVQPIMHSDGVLEDIDEYAMFEGTEMPAMDRDGDIGRVELEINGDKAAGLVVDFLGGGRYVLALMPYFGEIDLIESPESS